ncbi:uncharacterized protein LOC131931749 [Physella acuta]|uniref:uncharacterized protein LOC131931749 n=1 Tax=Physella acuta TaxID=109671 RepID=UPI0027DD212C|nr:uncharacterized protein LOC131931749 [Physella acuta]XP_059144577.1 uncharacterized protein LOC131931749 [Physella acuta]
MEQSCQTSASDIFWGHAFQTFIEVIRMIVILSLFWKQVKKFIYSEKDEKLEQIEKVRKGVDKILKMVEELNVESEERQLIFQEILSTVREINRKIDEKNLKEDLAMKENMLLED